MIIRDDEGLNDLGFSLRKTLKKLAPHNILKKISPVQALMRKPKRRGGGGAPPPEAGPAAQAAAPVGASSTPIPGGYQVEGNDASGNYFTYYFPDMASANAYNAQLQAQGGYGTVAPTPGTPGATPPYGGAPGADYGAPSPYGAPSAGGGGGGAAYGAPAYGPGAEDQDPYADEGGAPEEGEEGEQAPAADEPDRPKKLPKAPVVPPTPTVAPTMVDGGIPTWAWVVGGVIVAGGVYIVLKKKGIL